MKDSEKKTISKAKKIYNIVSTVVVLLVFVFLVAFIGFVMYQKTHGGEVTLFGYYMFDVVSDSMEPTIDVGEVIIAKKVEDADALQAGDVITFTAPSGQFKGRNITHRIIEVKKNDDGKVEYFKTKGDNPEVGVDDWQLEPSAVKAKFVRVSPFISGFRRFISKWYGYVVLIVIPLVLVGVLVVVGYVRDKVAEAKKEQESAKVNAEDLSDEQKRKLLEEYLASTDQDGAPEVEKNEVSDARNDENSDKNQEEKSDGDEQL